jgi:hypothetical protein
LLVTTAYEGAPFQHGRSSVDPGLPECGAPAPPGKVVNANSGVSVQWSIGGPTFRMEAQAMMFSLDVSSVRLELADGSTLTRKTKRLSSDQSAKARVRPFRYLAFATSPGICIETIVALDRQGVELASFAPSSCEDAVSR